MRELGRRSGEARRLKREQREAGELDVNAEIERLGMREWTDRQLIRVAQSSANAAAAVASLKEPRTRDLPDREQVTVEHARAALDARMAEVIARRIDHGECPQCGGSGRLWDAPGQGAGRQDPGVRGVGDLPPVRAQKFSAEPPPVPPVPPASVAGLPGGENPRLSRRRRGVCGRGPSRGGVSQTTTATRSRLRSTSGSSLSRIWRATARYPC